MSICCELRTLARAAHSRVEYSITPWWADDLRPDHLIDVLRLLTPHAVALALLAGARRPRRRGRRSRRADRRLVSRLDRRRGHAAARSPIGRHLRRASAGGGFEVYAATSGFPVPPDKIIRTGKPAGSRDLLLPGRP